MIQVDGTGLLIFIFAIVEFSGLAIVPGRLLALGVLTLIQQLGKTKNVKANQGFLRR